MRYMLSTVLSPAYKVTAVADCSTALQHLNTDDNQDLIILDIPDTTSDNFKLLEHLSSSSFTNTIPMVVISESSDKELEDRALQSGAVAFLPKPFDPRILADKVRQLTHGDTAEVTARRRRFINLNIF